MHVNVVAYVVNGVVRSYATLVYLHYITPLRHPRCYFY